MINARGTFNTSPHVTKCAWRYWRRLPFPEAAMTADVRGTKPQHFDSAFEYHEGPGARRPAIKAKQWSEAEREQVSLLHLEAERCIQESRSLVVEARLLLAEVARLRAS
jgi:hypothetical protein